MATRQITVRYHSTPEGWWAESPDLQGFTAVGATFNEVRRLAFEGTLEFGEWAEDDVVVVVEEPPAHSAPAPAAELRVAEETAGPKVRWMKVPA